MSQQFSLELLEARLMLSGDLSVVTCSALMADTDLMRLTYDIPAVELEFRPAEDQAATLTRATIADAPLIANVGEPLLPVYTTQIVLPYGFDVTGVTVQADDKVTLDGTYHIELATELNALSYGDNGSASPLDALYDVVGVGSRRGVNILTVNLMPVEYLQATGTISYYDEFFVDVQLALSSEVSSITYRPDDIRPLADQVDNPDVLSSYETGGEGEAAPLSSMVDPADSYDYVIITNNALATASADYDLADFITHKEGMGYTVSMVTVEDIYANYTGDDTPEQVRNFIIDAYDNWETDFVLLGGDSTVIPVRKLLVLGIAPDYIDSDFYYQCLDGDFDGNNNGIYGEYPSDDVDFYADVYLGRAAFDNTTRMSNWVYKTITYENTLHDAYRYNAEMVGEYIGGGGVTEYAKESLEELRTWYFAQDPDFTVDTLYAKDQSWSSGTLVGDMNTDEYAIFNGLGHGAGGIVMDTDYSYFDSYLTNDKFFFAYSQACWSGYMLGDSVAEHLTTYTRHGASAVIFNSSFGWYYSNYTGGPSHILNRQFWDALFGEEINQLGAMNADSHEDNLGQVGNNQVRAVIYCTTLFGDPSLEVVPMDLTIMLNEPDLGYLDEAYSFDLDAKNGTPPYSFAIIDGALPDGLALAPNTGLISGSPSEAGDFAFTIEVTDDNSDTATRECALTVLDRLELLVTELPDGYVDVHYNVVLDVTGGTTPYVWALESGSSLPDGLSLDSDTGLLNGTPTTAGSYSFTVEVNDSGTHQQVTTQPYALDIAVLAPGVYGQVFNDLNGNGQQDAGEIGLNGVTVEVVDLATGLVVDTTVSAAFDNSADGTFDPMLECGLYSFTGLAPSYYEVRQVDQAGWNQTTLVSYPGRLFTLRSVGSDLTINEHDPDTGEIINSFAAPQTTLGAGMQGLAVGASSLLFIDSGDLAAQPILYELNLESGTVIDSDTIACALPAMTMGMGVMGDLAYIQSSPNEILVFNYATDQVVDTLTVSVLLMGGLTAAPDMGLLFGSNSAGNIYKIDPSTGEVLDTFNPHMGSFNGGLGYYGGELIAAAKTIGVTNLAYWIDPVTGALLGMLELSGEGDMVGIGGDEVAPAAYGAYRICMAADSIVQGKDFGNEVQLLGDVDCDGDVDAIDIDIVSDGFGETGLIEPLCDLDVDGDVDQADVDVLVRDVLNTEYGDFNLDGIIDTTDLARLALNYGDDDWGWSDGNANRHIDTNIDTTDLAILAMYFGFEAGAPDMLGDGAPPAGADRETQAPVETVEESAPLQADPAAPSRPVAGDTVRTIDQPAPRPLVKVAATTVIDITNVPTARPRALTVTSPARPARHGAAKIDSSALEPLAMSWAGPDRVGRAPASRARRQVRFRPAAEVESAGATVDFSLPVAQLSAAPATARDLTGSADTGQLDAGLVDVLDEVDPVL